MLCQQLAYKKQYAQSVRSSGIVLASLDGDDDLARSMLRWALALQHTCYAEVLDLLGWLVSPRSITCYNDEWERLPTTIPQPWKAINEKAIPKRLIPLQPAHVPLAQLGIRSHKTAFPEVKGNLSGDPSHEERPWDLGRQSNDASGIACQNNGISKC